MLTDIIDFLGGSTNAFGSLARLLLIRLRNYRAVVDASTCGTAAEFDELCARAPKVRSELAQCPVAHPVVLVDSARTSGGGTTLRVAFLDCRLHCRHVFSVLVRGRSLALPGVPCYWNL